MKTKNIISIILAIIALPLVFASVNFNTGIAGSTQTNFFTGGTIPRCELNDLANKAIWVYNDGTRVNAMENCYIPGGLAASSNNPYDYCCPAQRGYSCIKNISLNKWMCVKTSTQTLSCADYKTKDTCEGANKEDIAGSIYSMILSSLTQSGIDISSLGTPTFCNTQGNPFEIRTRDNKCELYYGCACSWNQSSGSCLGLAYSQKQDCEEPFPENPQEQKKSWCQTDINVNEDRCNSDNVYYIEWTGNYYENEIPIGETESCKGGSKEFECPAVSVAPFFTIINLIISCLAIAGVYLVLRKKK